MPDLQQPENTASPLPLPRSARWGNHHSLRTVSFVPSTPALPTASHRAHHATMNNDPNIAHNSRLQNLAGKLQSLKKSGDFENTAKIAKAEVEKIAKISPTDGVTAFSLVLKNTEGPAKAKFLAEMADKHPQFTSETLAGLKQPVDLKGADLTKLQPGDMRNIVTLPNINMNGSTWPANVNLAGLTLTGTRHVNAPGLILDGARGDGKLIGNHGGGAINNDHSEFAQKNAIAIQLRGGTPDKKFVHTDENGQRQTFAQAKQGGLQELKNSVKAAVHKQSAPSPFGSP